MAGRYITERSIEEMMKERVLSTELIFQGEVVTLKVNSIELPNGIKTTREIIEHRGAVAIVALDNDDNVLMVRQYRGAADEELLEIPAGGVESGEDPDLTACRELQEETGYFPQNLKKLGGFYSAPGFCTEYLHLYLATDLVEKPLVAEDTDSIDVIRIPRADIPGLITSGKIHDAKSIAGLLSFPLYE